MMVDCAASNQCEFLFRNETSLKFLQHSHQNEESKMERLVSCHSNFERREALDIDKCFLTKKVD